MRIRFILIITVAWLAACEIGAQPPSNAAQAGESTAKPCVVVFGAVKAPSRFELRRSVRLAEALAMVGGATENVAGQIKLVHSDLICVQGTPIYRITDHGLVPAKFEVHDLAELSQGIEKANPFLQPGDTVIVEEIGPIYVGGNVKRPQQILQTRPVTLTQAIEMAGGVLPDTRTNDVVIYRKKGDRLAAIEITVDVKAVKKHSAEDTILQPYDYVDVPHKTTIRGPQIFIGIDLSPKVQLPWRIIQ